MAWLNDGAIQGLLLGSGGVLVWSLALYVASRAPTRRAPMLAAFAVPIGEDDVDAVLRSVQDANGGALPDDVVLITASPR